MTPGEREKREENLIAAFCAFLFLSSGENSTVMNGISILLGNNILCCCRIED